MSGFPTSDYDDLAKLLRADADKSYLPAILSNNFNLILGALDVASKASPETRMAEIDVSLRNFGAELSALGTALEAVEKCSINARSKFQAVQDRRQELMAEFAMLRADRRKS